MKSEKENQNDVWKGLSDIGATLFRNNVGCLRDKEGNFIRYGVANPGGSDLIGIFPVTITVDMIGQKIGVFLGVECKRKDGTLSSHQKNFLRVVRENGGIAEVYRGEDIELFIHSLRLGKPGT